jgi:hypothetical protein
MLEVHQKPDESYEEAVERTIRIKIISNDFGEDFPDF